MAKFVRYRDTQGRFTKRHKQRYITPEVVDTADGTITRIGNARRGIDKFDEWTLIRTYAAPKLEVQPDVVLRSFRSLHDTLAPAAETLRGYKLADVEVWMNGERIVAKLKIPLVATDRKKRGRWNGREMNETPMDRVRFEIKRALEEMGYAVTPEEDRRGWGDKRTKAYARDKYDYHTEQHLIALRAEAAAAKPRTADRRRINRAIREAEAAGTVVRPKLKTIKPKIVIRGYK